MSCETNFYQYDDLLIRSLAPIVIKTLDEKNRLLILCQDEKQVKEIDLDLWSYGRNKFIPHATILDKDIDLKRQPVLITTKEENQNDANYLVFLTKTNNDFVNKFKRAFYFYSESDMQNAENLVKILNPKNTFKKENGKWIKS